jgi:hypothetical protein
VIGSSVSERDEKRISGDLNIRATPTWLNGFRDRLGTDATEAGGRMFQSEVTSEDLSRQIVDVEAALRAKTTLRDRLQQILATRPGQVSELLEVERELAQVQGEIDATQSALTMMRARVAMSEVSIRYESVVAMPSSSSWAPVLRAIGDIGSAFAGSLAVMIQVVAVVVPWSLIAVAIYWGVRKRRKNSKPKDAAGPTVK